MSSFSSRNEYLTLVLKIYSKRDIKVFWSCPILPDFITFCQIFWQGLQKWNLQTHYQIHIARFLQLTGHVSNSQKLQINQLRKLQQIFLSSTSLSICSVMASKQSWWLYRNRVLLIWKKVIEIALNLIIHTFFMHFWK